MEVFYCVRIKVDSKFANSLENKIESGLLEVAVSSSLSDIYEEIKQTTVERLKSRWGNGRASIETVVTALFFERPPVDYAYTASFIYTANGEKKTHIVDGVVQRFPEEDLATFKNRTRKEITDRAIAERRVPVGASLVFTSLTPDSPN